jgi:hypothetical protein
MKVDEAQAVIDGFLRTYPAVPRWQQRQAEKAKRNDAVSTVGGRVYRFSWEPGQKYARNLALNLPVQGTAAEIAVEATIRISNRLDKELPGQAQLVVQVHDEFVVEADEREEVVSAVETILEEEMTAAFTFLFRERQRPDLSMRMLGRTGRQQRTTKAGRAVPPVPPVPGSRQCTARGRCSQVREFYRSCDEGALHDAPAVRLSIQRAQPYPPDGSDLVSGASPLTPPDLNT